jgi:arylsulfatase A-like enzyme
VRFTQFYNTARCWPTRGALLSGYYAQQIHRDALPQVPGGGQGARPKWARLLPDLLKSAHYRSYHSGKWHIDGDVLASGFDRSLHTRNDGNYFTWGDLTAGQCRFQATKMAIHAAMIDRMDQEIGRLLAHLEATGALENTLIFFASDNGASAEIMVRQGGHDPHAAPGSASSYLCLGPGFSSACNTPFRRHKTWVHEGGISTPFIAHWPKGITAKNELRHTPAHVIDVVPTVLELAGVQKPASWDGEPIPPAPGRSLAPALARDEASRPDTLWWLHDGHRAIRIGDWKLVAAKGEPWHLHDLKTDRAEQHDLAATMPEKVRELEHAWQRQTDSFTELAKKTASPRVQ